MDERSQNQASRTGKKGKNVKIYGEDENLAKSMKLDTIFWLLPSKSLHAYTH